MLSTTIVACATGSVRAGISIVRLSGSQASAIAEKVTHKPCAKPNMATYRAMYANDGALLDKGVVVFFRGPASFTGEDLVELQTHGSPFIVDQVIKACLDHGAVYAQPGEFSERAFLNGKIDLVQAESIADLIAAQSSAQATAALASLQGALSHEVQALQAGLTAIRTQIEAGIDFADQAIDTDAYALAQAAMAQLRDQMQDLVQKVQRGIHNQSGLRVAMVGAPNVGKSSLMNQLTQQESAIVTDIPGTTRDVIKASIAVQGQAMEIMDTAGIRETQDPIEKIGVQKAYAALDEADVIWLMIDASQAGEEDIRRECAVLGENRKKALVVSNKNDLLSTSTGQQGAIDCAISAKQGSGIDALLSMTLARQSSVLSCEFSARQRHLSALTECSHWLDKAIQVPEGLMDAAAEDLRLAQNQLSVLTGQFHNEDLLDQIFRTFCLGK